MRRCRKVVQEITGFFSLAISHGEIIGPSIERVLCHIGERFGERPELRLRTHVEEIADMAGQADETADRLVEECLGLLESKRIGSRETRDRTECDGTDRLCGKLQR